MRDERRVWLEVLLCCALALGVRLFGLSDHGIWADELQRILWAGGHDPVEYFGKAADSFTVRQAPETWSTTLEVIQRHNPPLYGLLLHGWMLLVGVNSDALLRLPSVLAGVLMVACVYFAGIAAGYGRRTARIAALVAALLPALVAHAQEINFYTLATLWVALSILLYHRWRKNPRVATGLAWGLCWGMALLTHYCTAFMLLGQVVALWRRNGEKPPTVRRYALWPVAMGLTIFAGQVPTTLIQLREITAPGQIGEFGGLNQLVKGMRGLLLNFWGGDRHALPEGAILALSFVVLAWMVQHAWPDDDDNSELLWMTCLPIVGILAAFFALKANSLLWPRYWLMFTPSVCLLIGRIWPRTPSVAAAAACLAVVCASVGLMKQNRYPREVWKQVGNTINSIAKDDDAVLVYRSNLVESCARYIRKPLLMFGVTVDDRLDSALDVATSGRDAVWLATAWVEGPDSQRRLENALSQRYAKKDVFVLPESVIAGHLLRFSKPRPHLNSHTDCLEETAPGGAIVEKAWLDQATQELHDQWVVRGWAFSTAGARRLIMNLDGEVQQSTAHAHLMRWDVQAAIPAGGAHAGASGFWFPWGRLPPGKHSWQLRIERCDGSISPPLGNTLEIVVPPHTTPIAFN